MQKNINLTGKVKTIKCPYCGWEYLPEEIIYPDYVVGRRKEVTKTNAGKIDFYLGRDEDTIEEFTCDSCGGHFYVETEINYKTFIDKDRDFSDDYVSTVLENPNTLEEESLF